MRKRLTFSEQYKLDEMSIGLLRKELTGIYFISLDNLTIQYPFVESSLIYIGMSESSRHSIAKRLRAHISGQSGNEAIANYAKKHAVRFTYHSRDVLSVVGTDDVRELESFFLFDFARKHGSFPICNGQAGTEFPESKLPQSQIIVSWEDFR
jgi:hypothetical protein